ncbi:oxaA-like protein [Streptococcus pneumoniae GA54354]|nr:oxaA-like protein [Streptococcus pneumoniae GA54354]
MLMDKTFLHRQLLKNLINVLYTYFQEKKRENLKKNSVSLKTLIS